MNSVDFLSRACFGLTIFLIAMTAHSQTPATQPSKLTGEQDHRRVMDVLGIKELRSGANPNKDSKNPPNYDESKAEPYPNLPDPLVCHDGSKVTDAKTWTENRRPEIVEDFEREVYGRVPANAPSVKWEIISTANETKGNVPVITRKLLGHVDSSKYPAIPVDIRLTIVTPANAKGPVPLMMEFGFEFRPRPTTGTSQPASRPASRPAVQGPDWQQLLAEKGWGSAVIYPVSYQADNADGLSQGIIGLTNLGEPRKLDDWGALRAWAWGASRALDYFQTDPTIDAKHVGIEGLSRFGKAALVTMAMDERFAIGFVASSGAGGAKLLRRDFGERVENLAGGGAYHWMTGNFLKYAGPLNPGDLPVDAHELIALCAPRPVFVSCGSPKVEGEWIDDVGMFKATVAAGPVYQLLGKKDLGTTQFPEIETPLVAGDLAFRQHTGGHTAGPNWPTFIEFAPRYFEKNQ